MQQFNFCSGPATLPAPVMKQVHDEFYNVLGTGLSILEISHRSDTFLNILETAKADLKNLLNIPDDYHICFLSGGASLQFALFAMNFGVPNNVLDYIQTGYWSKKAVGEAKQAGFTVHETPQIATNCQALPNEFSFSSNSKYTHITLNETIDGLEFFDLPQTPSYLVGDLSSTILSRPIDVKKFGCIYAGCQKNIAPAGMTIMIIKDKFLSTANTNLAKILSYRTHVESNSLYNTPCVFSLYFAGKVFSYLRSLGGLEVLAEKNAQKANQFYQYLDQSDFYDSFVKKGSRSHMNVPFLIKTPNLEKKFIEQAQQNGLHNLSGHRSKGGLRASFYNAMPLEGVHALINFMKDFEKNYA